MNLTVYEMLLKRFVLITQIVFESSILSLAAVLSP